ncbi:uncharacterized protein EV420DRAFT_1267822 [Desarmillaria tabescens]|uniref:Helitron helicase-like domain-containing protein n=1 Tax=Armillaria tabescens TaxID=1929756 RepID=A0AA39TN36_ARMTA|nr:uncharacterized protein EV420DRAFT_1267822 [Desarmillaria tabescens]KAK0460498.1 hypothetical protein EV420DRAFT_1267822 [Desarmillaria tabescens]
MKAFIKTILAYDKKQDNLEGGILGLVKAYYGCVEAQGHRTLHCYMMVWVEGSLNPDEIKNRIMLQNDVEFRDRLLSFLDDSISNEIPPEPEPDIYVPSDGVHACTVHGIQNNIPPLHRDRARHKDLHNLVEDCQKHSHSKTCFKYCGKHERICRFDLDEKNYREHSTFDYEKGELCLRCLDGLVNNFNETMIRAVWCNMDIKFIGSGASAKAILYYITDYITKSQLKVHVAYAALELSVKKLGEFNPQEDDITVRAKRLLQCCAYAMISHQELSSQQVASYLMDYKDHFTSHKFQHLYWTSFKSFLNEEQPSPECQPIPSKETESDPQDMERLFMDLDRLAGEGPADTLASEDHDENSADSDHSRQPIINTDDDDDNEDEPESDTVEEELLRVHDNGEHEVFLSMDDKGKLIA